MRQTLSLDLLNLEHLLAAEPSLDHSHQAWLWLSNLDHLPPAGDYVPASSHRAFSRYSNAQGVGQWCYLDGDTHPLVDPSLWPALDACRVLAYLNQAQEFYGKLDSAPIQAFRAKFDETLELLNLQLG